MFTLVRDRERNQDPLFPIVLILLFIIHKELSRDRNGNIGTMYYVEVLTLLK